MAYRNIRRGLGALTIPDLASAITRNEGSCPSPSSCRNNNPGNLRAGPGATGVDSRGIAVFPDFSTGESALENQISLNVNRGLTLDQFFGGSPGVYAGYDKTDPNYASKVAGWLGIPQDVPLGSLLSGSGDTSPAAAPSDSSTALEAAGIDLSSVDLSNPLVIGGLALAAALAVWMLARG
jgi:hypothetical protein